MGAALQVWWRGASAMRRESRLGTGPCCFGACQSGAGRPAWPPSRRGPPPKGAVNGMCSEARRSSRLTAGPCRVDLLIASEE